MVGRRYRDVLEASNVTRRLTEIANDLSSQVHSMREIISQSRSLAARAPIKRQPIHRFVLLNRILPLVIFTFIKN
jgi:hypothetical protein